MVKSAIPSLRGVYSAMPTPLTTDLKVDRDATRKVVEYLHSGGVSGLSILGSTGECAGLSRQQRWQLVKAVVEAVNGRMTIFGGATGTVVDDLVADLQPLGGLGIAAALVPPPSYFSLSASEVYDFYQRLAENSPVPILLYNIPGMTRVSLAVQTVARLAEHPNIAGIKDSAGNLAYFTEIVRIGAGRNDFTVFTGGDLIFAPSLLAGAQGLIGAGVNVAPELFVDILRTFDQGDHEQAMTLQRQACDVMAACRIGGYPAEFKSVLAMKGLCQPTMTRPLQPLTEEQRADLRSRLAAVGVAAR